MTKLKRVGTKSQVRVWLIQTPMIFTMNGWFLKCRMWLVHTGQEEMRAMQRTVRKSSFGRWAKEKMSQKQRGAAIQVPQEEKGASQEGGSGWHYKQVQTLRKIKTGNSSKFSIEEVVKIFGKNRCSEVIGSEPTMKAEGEKGGKRRQPPESLAVNGRRWGAIKAEFLLIYALSK